MDEVRMAPGVGALVAGLTAAALTVATSGAVWGQERRAMTVDDLLTVKSVGDPQVSPDGTRVAYVVTEVDREAGRSNSSIWLASLSGGEPRRLTTTGGSNTEPRWSPDGRTLAFVSSRSGSSQVWLLDMEGPGEPRQLTKLPIDVSGIVWSPRGDAMAVAGEVYPGKSPEETAKEDAARAAAPSKVRIHDDLMVKHWASWDEGRRSHVFLVNAADGSARDLIPDWTANVPPKPFGGSDDYAFSPDGAELAFTSEPLREHAWSTNTDIWAVATGEAGAKPRNLTEGHEGSDAHPSYSPDGSRLAFLRMDRAGFEADQTVLTILDRASGKFASLTGRLDRPVQSMGWSKDSREILATIDDAGSVSVIAVDPNGGEVEPGIRRLATNGTHGSPQRAAGGALVYTRNRSDHPTEIFAAEADGSNPRALTRHNAELVGRLDLSRAEGFSFEGADGDEVSGWLVRPPGFDPSRKYPVAFLIHGGPQGAWHDDWHARWNYQLFAAPGYAVVAVNPRGSTGYGQRFTDQISGDWTGRVYEDLTRGLDHALAKYPFLDGERMAALGGSYGGFMVNWIAGNSDRFKALVSHAGVFDLHSMYFTTEELWFAEWEFGGPPWSARDPKLYFDQSPSLKAGNFRTPTLVIHGALDFRVPDSQGLGMFTALRRRGVPARHVWFPDEGHWILKPANRIVWWNEVHGWLEKYLK